MSEQDTVDLDTSNQTADDTSVSDTDNNDQGNDSANDEHDLEWYKQQNEKLFNRAKEAEGYKKVDGKWVKKEKPQPIKANAAKPESIKQTGELSARDIIVLSNSGIKETEDIDEVLDFIAYRKSKGESIDVAAALSHSTLKSILADKAEKRRVAEVTNTSGSRRVTTKISGETLLANAQSKGVVPDSDDQMNELVKARLFRNKK